MLAEALDADVLLVAHRRAARDARLRHAEQAPILREPPRPACASLDFAAGSMGPKVDAVCRFVELTGGMAAIGSLDDAAAILAGEAGTIVTPNGHYDAETSTGPRVRPLRAAAS